MLRAVYTLILVAVVLVAALRWLNREQKTRVITITLPRLCATTIEAARSIAANSPADELVEKHLAIKLEPLSRLGVMESDGDYVKAVVISSDTNQGAECYLPKGDIH